MAIDTHAVRAIGQRKHQWLTGIVRAPWRVVQQLRRRSVGPQPGVIVDPPLLVAQPHLPDDGRDGGAVGAESQPVLEPVVPRVDCRQGGAAGSELGLRRAIGPGEGRPVARPAVAVRRRANLQSDARALWRVGLPRDPTLLARLRHSLRPREHLAFGRVLRRIGLREPGNALQPELPRTEQVRRVEADLNDSRRCAARGPRLDGHVVPGVAGGGETEGSCLQGTAVAIQPANPVLARLLVALGHRQVERMCGGDRQPAQRSLGNRNGRRRELEGRVDLLVVAVYEQAPAPSRIVGDLDLQGLLVVLDLPVPQIAIESPLDDRLPAAGQLHGVVLARRAGDVATRAESRCSIRSERARF